MKMVLSKGFQSLKQRIIVATIALISAWMMPAFAELNINNSQSVRLVENAKESQYFTETIRIMQSSEELRLLEALDIKQYVVDAVDIPSNIVKEYNALGIIFEFATVEGSAGGAITGPVLAQIPVKNQPEFTLTVPKNIDTKPIKFDGLKVNTYGKPVDFARLSTLSKSKSSSRLGGAGFIDGITGNHIVLVYTSGKVDILGEKIENNDKYVYKVNLPSKGWHWIINTENDNNKHTITWIDRADIDPIIYAL